MGAALVPGQVLAGKYRVERIIGQGGFGIVIAAHHLQLDERVAIKLLLPEIAQNAEAVARFVREGRASIKIRSEHVVRVFDVASLDTGEPYMVMEYLEGADLAAQVRRSGAFEPHLAVDCLLQACEALAEAHALGIVHRDLKPANLFATRRRDGSPSIKVLDFGISKITKADERGMTSSGVIVGSPRYMSPEQMRSSKQVDARTDVWSLGVIAYELLSGAPPFDAASYPELFAKISREPAPPLRSPRGPLPAGLQAAIAKSLEKDPARRFADVALFAAAIAPFGGAGARASAERIQRVLGAPVVVHGSGPPSSGFSAEGATVMLPGAPNAVATADGLGVSTAPTPPRRVPIAVLAGPLVLVLGVGVAIYFAVAARARRVEAPGAASSASAVVVAGPAPPALSLLELPSQPSGAAAPSVSASASASASARPTAPSSSPSARGRPFPASTSSAAPPSPSPDDRSLFHNRN